MRCATQERSSPAGGWRRPCLPRPRTDSGATWAARTSRAHACRPARPSGAPPSPCGARAPSRTGMATDRGGSRPRRALACGSTPGGPRCPSGGCGGVLPTGSVTPTRSAGPTWRWRRLRGAHGASSAGKSRSRLQRRGRRWASQPRGSGRSRPGHGPRPSCGGFPRCARCWPGRSCKPRRGPDGLRPGLPKSPPPFRRRWRWADDGWGAPAIVHCPLQRPTDKKSHALCGSA
jgi:hypothetical protein